MPANEHRVNVKYENIAILILRVKKGAFVDTHRSQSHGIGTHTTDTIHITIHSKTFKFNAKTYATDQFGWMDDRTHIVISYTAKLYVQSFGQSTCQNVLIHK